MQVPRACILACAGRVVGMTVAEYLNENNRQGNSRTVKLLGLQPGDRVLEIGFGNGRTVADVLSQAANIRYTGIDISQTMVGEAARFNATLVAEGSAGFRLASADHLPFSAAAFERAFSTGVIYFWDTPARPFAEVRRVLSGRGMMIMSCRDNLTP